MSKWAQLKLKEPAQVGPTHCYSNGLRATGGWAASKPAWVKRIAKPALQSKKCSALNISGCIRLRAASAEALPSSSVSNFDCPAQSNAQMRPTSFVEKRWEKATQPTQTRLSDFPSECLCFFIWNLTINWINWSTNSQGSGSLSGNYFPQKSEGFCWALLCWDRSIWSQRQFQACLQLRLISLCADAPVATGTSPTWKNVLQTCFSKWKVFILIHLCQIYVMRIYVDRDDLNSLSLFFYTSTSSGSSGSTGSCTFSQV